MPVLAKMGFPVAAFRRDLIVRAWLYPHQQQLRLYNLFFPSVLRLLTSSSAVSLNRTYTTIALFVAALVLPSGNAEARSENLVDLANALGLAATLAMTLLMVSAVFATIAFFVFYVVSSVLGMAEARTRIIPEPYPKQKSRGSAAAAIDKLIGVAMRSWRTGIILATGAHRLSGPTDLLVRRMTALGLNAHTVGQITPNRFCDLRRVCATCESNELCNWDLEHNPTDQSWQDYCPNAAALRSLSGLPWLKRELSPWMLL